MFRSCLQNSQLLYNTNLYIVLFKMLIIILFTYIDKFLFIIKHRVYCNILVINNKIYLKNFPTSCQLKYIICIVYFFSSISPYVLLNCYDSEYLPVESDGKVSAFPPSPMYITARIPKNKASTTTKITDTILWLFRISSLFVDDGLNILFTVSRDLSANDVVCLELKKIHLFNSII